MNLSTKCVLYSILGVVFGMSNIDILSLGGASVVFLLMTAEYIDYKRKGDEK